MKWETARLEDLCEFIVDCPHSTAKDEGIGYPLIRTPNIGKGRLVFSNLHRVSEEVYIRRNKRATPKNDDIILAREAPAGNVAIIKNDEKVCLGQRTVLLRPNKKLVCPDYLVYHLLAPKQQYQLLGSANGATVPHVNIPVIKSLCLEMHPLPIQHRIASILSAYDDLIENNRKQIKLLEEAAQRLYKEWFVDFKFPGHENVKIVDGVLEGWERKTLAQCLKMYINGGWGKEQPNGKNLYKGRVIRGTDIKDVRMGNFLDVPLRYHTENDIKKRKLNINDIVFELSNGNIDNLGRCLFVDSFIEKELGENSICASFCKLLRPINKLHSIIIYWEIQYMHSSKRIVPFRKNGSNGINNFAFDKFLSHSFLMPTNYEFIKPFEDIMSKIENIREQLMLLKEARDHLLPKLMSGEIEV